MPFLSETSRQTKPLQNYQNQEISYAGVRYDDSIISERNNVPNDNQTNENHMVIFPEEEPSELIENKFRYTYAGISKEDIMQRSTKDLFNKIKINLQNSNRHITHMEQKIYRAKAKHHSQSRSLMRQYDRAKKAYLQDKTPMSMQKLNLIQHQFWAHKNKSIQQT